MERTNRRQVEETTGAIRSSKRNENGLLGNWGPYMQHVARLIIKITAPYLHPPHPPFPFTMPQELLDRIISQFGGLVLL